MAKLKGCIAEVVAAENCLTHVLVIAIAKADRDPNYESHRRGYMTRLVLRNQLVAIGIDPCTPQIPRTFYGL